MNPRRTLQENESALRKVLTQRTLEALSKQNVAFVLEHQNDTLEQLSAYLSACMDTLGHVPAWTEVLGGDLIDLRFGGWAQALHSIGQTSGCWTSRRSLRRKPSAANAQSRTRPRAKRKNSEIRSTD